MRKLMGDIGLEPACMEQHTGCSRIKRGEIANGRPRLDYEASKLAVASFAAALDDADHVFNRLGNGSIPDGHVTTVAHVSELCNNACIPVAGEAESKGKAHFG